MGRLRVRELEIRSMTRESSLLMFYHMLQFVDADVFLTSSSSLTTLIELNRPIVAPMLASDGLYSNFW